MVNFALRGSSFFFVVSLFLGFSRSHEEFFFFLLDEAAIVFFPFGGFKDLLDFNFFFDFSFITRFGFKVRVQFLYVVD